MIISIYVCVKLLYCNICYMYVLYSFYMFQIIVVTGLTYAYLCTYLVKEFVLLTNFIFKVALTSCRKL